AFYWLASWPVKNFAVRLTGMILMTATLATALGMSPFHVRDHIPPGGLLGKVLADTLQSSFNAPGSIVVLLAALLISLFLSTTFSFAGAVTFLKPRFRFVSNWSERWSDWQAERARARAAQQAEPKKEKTPKKQSIITEKTKPVAEPKQEV